MNRYNTVLAAAAVSVAAACATPNPPNQEAQQSPEDKGYVTGSRLPVRNGGTTADVKGISGKDAMDAARRNTTAPAPPMPGK
jgi:hypothetical protein